MADGAGPRITHLDDVPWEEVRKIDFGDRTASVREKWLDFSPRFLSLLAEWDPGMMIHAHGHNSNHVVYVLAGDMSLIGPRPTLGYQVDQYTDFQRRRLEVRPGVTGWAQVRGRNAISWPRRIELDVWYVDRRCARLDLEIVARTVAVLLRSESVYNEAQGDWGEPETVEGAGA